MSKRAVPQGSLEINASNELDPEGLSDGIIFTVNDEGAVLVTGFNQGGYDGVTLDMARVIDFVRKHPSLRHILGE